MKLRTSSYNLFYALSLLFVGVCGFLILNSSATRTYAEDDEETYSTISGNHFVTIHDNGESVTVKTDAKTVGEVLERTNIEVDATDIVDPEISAEINADNYHINIYRSRPVIVTDGVVKKYISTASYDGNTIAAAAGFVVYDGDVVTSFENTENFLETGVTTTYKLEHKGGTTFTVEEDIPFNEITKNDYDITPGTEKLLQVGELGRKVTKYKVIFKDGVEVSREVISETVEKEPVDRITAIGMKAASNIPAEWETCAGWAREAGVSEENLYVALTLIYKESGCRVGARNSSSGAYGIPQALPGKKMASAGADWETNPVTQIKWMASYVTKRYGGWNEAWAWWSEHHWY